MPSVRTELLLQLMISRTLTAFLRDTAYPPATVMHTGPSAWVLVGDGPAISPGEPVPLERRLATVVLVDSSESPHIELVVSRLGAVHKQALCAALEQRTTLQVRLLPY